MSAVNKFWNDCYLARRFLVEGDPLKWGALDTAMSRIETIVVAEPPLILDNLAHIAYSYLHSDLGKYFRIILGHFKNMAAELKGHRHPFNKVFAMLYELQQPHLEHTLSSLQNCQAKEFQQRLGSFNEITVKVELTRLQSGTELLGIGVTKGYLKLLHRIANNLGYTSRQELEVRLALGWHYLHIHQWDKAGETTQQILDLRGQTKPVPLQYESIANYLHAISHHQRANEEQAGRSLRRAIHLAAETWGRQDSRVLKYMSVLQAWLTRWGKLDEAHYWSETIQAHVSSKQARIHAAEDERLRMKQHGLSSSSHRGHSSTQTHTR